MENKTMIKLVIVPGMAFVAGLSFFILFANEQAQEFYGLTTEGTTGNSNFIFYPITIYVFLIGCGTMYYRTEDLKYVEAILYLCASFLIVRVLSIAISGFEVSDYSLVVLPAEIFLAPILGYLWYREKMALNES